MADVDADLLKRGGVQFAVDGELATITLDRPESLNAQTPSMWQALAQIGERLAPEVRVVVVRGAGRSFSAGLDRRMFTVDGAPGEPGLGQLAERPAAEIEQTLIGYQAGFAWLTDPARVTVAAVQGHAIGGGFQLALACDIRLAAEGAQFTMAEPTLGIVPDLGGTLPLVRAVGYARAVEICLTGRRVPAAEALRIGLVNDVVPVADLDRTVDELVTVLLKPLAGATRETLALLAAAADGPTLDEQRAAERAAQIRRFTELRNS